MNGVDGLRAAAAVRDAMHRCSRASGVWRERLRHYGTDCGDAAGIPGTGGGP